ncbi:unnamed protein product [Prorocentrum cordatum]|uniref:DUF1995 domain-containing protein n=1 Tax=Prorocentrum cordatum TaxID=2364126 RepID=A0ABN9XUM9_9DINO|nr:unnamed protein product [Polarella glacialis]
MAAPRRPCRPLCGRRLGRDLGSGAADVSPPGAAAWEPARLRPRRARAAGPRAPPRAAHRRRRGGQLAVGRARLHAAAARHAELHGGHVQAGRGCRHAGVQGRLHQAVGASFRTDVVFREGAGDSCQKLLQQTLPLAKSFASKLWGGESLKQVRTQPVSPIDDEVATLLYREAENAIMDAAVFYLPGRAVVTSPRVGTFFQNMGDRLVVLANTEQAPEPWKVDNQGQDFYLTSTADVGTEICQMFEMQAYYFCQTPINNWQTTFFRVYPAPWQIFIEDFDHNLVLLGTSPSKPDYSRIQRWMGKYEKENGIAAWKKVGKMLKDNQASDGREPPRRPLGMGAR